MTSHKDYEITEMLDGNLSDFDYFENEDEENEDDEWYQNEGTLYILFYVIFYY